MFLSSGLRLVYHRLTYWLFRLIYLAVAGHLRNLSTYYYHNRIMRSIWVYFITEPSNDSRSVIIVAYMYHCQFLSLDIDRPLPPFARRPLRRILTQHIISSHVVVLAKRALDGIRFYFGPTSGLWHKIGRNNNRTGPFCYLLCRAVSTWVHLFIL